MFNLSNNRSHWNRYIHKLKSKLILERAVRKVTANLESHHVSRKRIGRCVQQLFDNPVVLLKKMPVSRYSHRHGRSKSTDRDNQSKKIRSKSLDRRREKKSSPLQNKTNSHVSRRENKPEPPCKMNKKPSRSRSPFEISGKPAEKRVKNHSPSPPRTMNSATSRSTPASPILFSKGRRKSRVAENDVRKISDPSRKSSNDKRPQETLAEKLDRVKRKEKVEFSKKYYRPKQKIDLKQYKKIFSPEKKVEQKKSTATKHKIDNMANSSTSKNNEDNFNTFRLENIRSATRRLEFEKNLDDLVMSVSKSSSLPNNVQISQVTKMHLENSSMEELLNAKHIIIDRLQSCSSPCSIVSNSSNIPVNEKFPTRLQKSSMPSLATNLPENCDQLDSQKMEESNEAISPIESSQNISLHTPQIIETIGNFIAKNNIDINLLSDALQKCGVPNIAKVSEKNMADHEVSSTSDHILPLKPEKTAETIDLKNILQCIPEGIDDSAIENIQRKREELLREQVHASKKLKSMPIPEKSNIPVEKVSLCTLSNVKSADPVKNVRKSVGKMPQEHNNVSTLTYLLNQPPNIQNGNVQSAAQKRKVSKPEQNFILRQQPSTTVTNPVTAPSSSTDSHLVAPSGPQIQPAFTSMDFQNISKALLHPNRGHIVQNSTVQPSYMPQTIQYPIAMTKIYPLNQVASHVKNSSANYTTMVHAPIYFPSTSTVSINKTRSPPTYSQSLMNQNINRGAAAKATPDQSCQRIKATLVCLPNNVTPVVAKTIANSGHAENLIRQNAASIHPTNSAPVRPANGPTSLCPPTRQSTKVSNQTASKCASDAASFEIIDLPNSQRESIKSVLRHVHSYHQHKKNWTTDILPRPESEEKNKLISEWQKKSRIYVSAVNIALQVLSQHCRTTDMLWIAQRVVSFAAKANPTSSRMTVNDILRFFYRDEKNRGKAPAPQGHIPADSRVRTHQTSARPATHAVRPSERPHVYPGHGIPPITKVPQFVPPVSKPVPLPIPISVSMFVTASVPSTVSKAPSAPAPVLTLPSPQSAPRLKFTTEQYKQFMEQAWQYRYYNRWIKDNLPEEKTTIEKPSIVTEIHQESKIITTVINSPISNSAPTWTTALEKLEQLSKERNFKKKNQEKSIDQKMSEDSQLNILDLSIKTPSVEVVSQNKPVASVKPLPNPESTVVEVISTEKTGQIMPKDTNKPSSDDKINSNAREIIEIDLSDDEKNIKVEASDNSEYMVDLAAEIVTKDIDQSIDNPTEPITIDLSDDERHSVISDDRDTVILGEECLEYDQSCIDEELECTKIAKVLDIKREYNEDLSDFTPVIMGVTTIDSDIFDKMPENIEKDIGTIGNVKDNIMCTNCNVKKRLSNCSCNEVGYCSQDCMKIHWLTYHANICRFSAVDGIKLEILDDDLTV